MRIMCVTVVLIIFISDRQKQPASSGSQSNPDGSRVCGNAARLPDEPLSPLRSTKNVSKPVEPLSPLRSARDVSKPVEPLSPLRSTKNVSKPDELLSPLRNTKNVSKPDEPLSPLRSTKNVSKPDEPLSPLRSTKNVSKPDELMLGKEKSKIQKEANQNQQKFTNGRLSRKDQATWNILSIVNMQPATTEKQVLSYRSLVDREHITTDKHSRNDNFRSSDHKRLLQSNVSIAGHKLVARSDFVLRFAVTAESHRLTTRQLGDGRLTIAQSNANTPSNSRFTSRKTRSIASRDGRSHEAPKKIRTRRHWRRSKKQEVNSTVVDATKSTATDNEDKKGNEHSVSLGGNRYHQSHREDAEVPLMSRPSQAINSVFDFESLTISAATSDGLLSEPTGIKKVTLLILFTFPPGVLLGYLAVATIFCLRNQRCLCCTEGCERGTSRLLRPSRQSSIHNSAGVATVEVSNRRISVPFRHRTLTKASFRDRNMLEQQFMEDRIHFQLTGKDTDNESEPGFLKPPRDDPNLSRKEWLQRRLEWWLRKDRIRSLSGQFTDPNSPPEGSPLSSSVEMRNARLRKKRSSFSDFSSVSQQQGHPKRMSEVGSTERPTVVSTEAPKRPRPEEVTTESTASSMESSVVTSTSDINKEETKDNIDKDNSKDTRSSASKIKSTSKT